MQECLSGVLVTCKASTVSLRKAQEEIKNGGLVVLSQKLQGEQKMTTPQP